MIKVTIFRWEDYHGLFRQVPNAITSLYDREAAGRLDTDSRGKKQCDHKGRHWSDGAISQDMLSATRSWKKQGTDSL